MLINQIRSAHRLKFKRRIGRGGKRGTYSGKGQKGQKARAGAKIRSEQREAILKIPKKRGVKFRNVPKKFVSPVVPVSLRDLEKTFRNNEQVSLKLLCQRGIVKKTSGRYPKVKILANVGKFEKKLYFSDLDVSEKAKELIEKAGGHVQAPGMLK